MLALTLQSARPLARRLSVWAIDIVRRSIPAPRPGLDPAPILPMNHYLELVQQHSDGHSFQHVRQWRTNLSQENDSEGEIEEILTRYTLSERGPSVYLDGDIRKASPNVADSPADHGRAVSEPPVKEERVDQW